MGTRNLICIRVNRQWVVAKYCRWDGYPTGQGVYLFDFLHVEGNIARLRAGLAYIYKPTQEELKEFQEALEAEVARLEGLDPMDIYNYLLPRMPPYLDLSILVSEEPREHEIRNLLSTFHQSALLFPSLSGGTGGHLLELIADATAIHKLPVESELEFAANWLYCEWVYIVDLDEEQLKVFGCREPNYEGHPFEEVCRDALDAPDAPKFMASFTFTELQSWDKEIFKKRAEEIEKEASAVWEEHNIVADERLTKCGIVMWNGSNAIEGDTIEGDTNEGDTSGGDTSGDEANEEEANEGDTDASEEDSGEDANMNDVNGDGANDGGADAAASQLDRLHLD